MTLSLKSLASIIVVSLVLGAGLMYKYKPGPAAQPPAAAPGEVKKGKKKSKTTITEDIVLPNGALGKKITQKEEEKETASTVTPAPNLKNIFGYTLNYNIKEFEFETKRISHSVIIGKKILEGYVDNLYGVAGADLDNKLMVQQIKAGIIKTN